MPSFWSESTITRVSSLSSAPRRRLVPLANAATIRARFVRLFEPGTVILAFSSTRVLGSMINSGGYSGIPSSLVFLFDLKATGRIVGNAHRPDAIFGRYLHGGQCPPYLSSDETFLR